LEKDYEVRRSAVRHEQTRAGFCAGPVAGISGILPATVRAQTVSGVPLASWNEGSAKQAIRKKKQNRYETLMSATQRNAR
jgi:hypothetical protein